MTYISNVVRPKGDPKVLERGPSSIGPSDQLARCLGWFSIGLGLTELFAPRSLTRALGMRGKEGLVRAYGAREIMSGVVSLSPDKRVGLWSRVAGDGLDFATLVSALHPYNPKRDNVKTALAMVIGITALDIIAANGVTAEHRRKANGQRDYSDRSGFPKGVNAIRGAARNIGSQVPPERSAQRSTAGFSAT